MKMVRVAAGAVTLALLAAACGERAQAGTTGDDLDVCTGVLFVLILDEPDPAEPADVVDYADDYARILGNVSDETRWEDRDGTLRLPPKLVLQDIGIQKRSMERLRADAKKAIQAGNRAAVLDGIRRAQAVLAADAAYREADRRLTKFLFESCREDYTQE